VARSGLAGQWSDLASNAIGVKWSHEMVKNDIAEAVGLGGGGKIIINAGPYNVKVAGTIKALKRLFKIQNLRSSESFL
jgi:hypothetical protein